MLVFFRLFNFKKLPLISMTVFLLLAGSQSVFAYSDDEILASIKDFDNEFKKLTSEVYSRRAANSLNASTSSAVSDYDRYVLEFNKLVNANRHLEAMTSIYANLDLIKDNVDNENTISIIEFLLSQNDYYTALELKEVISEYAEEYLMAKVDLLFAKYHNERNEWQAVLTSLDIELELLTNEDIEQAYLLNGIALQRLKQHRKAIQLYEQVSKDSKFYSLAQVNMAIAYIRQDWWSDAHIIINNLLNNDGVTKEDELINRLFLILGYSLLSKEYYRESRESFRNISLESQYTNKALLGISLAAIGQGDNKGALNAATILNKKNSDDLTREESFLLLPHIYKSLEQYVTANTSYTVAINHYQNRIDSLNHQILLSRASAIEKDLESHLQEIMITNSTFNLKQSYPAFFFENYAKLLRLKNELDSPESLAKVNEFINRYKTAVKQAIESSLNIRVAALQSYLSQAHFGIAQLYDKDHE